MDTDLIYFSSPFSHAERDLLGRTIKRVEARGGFREPPTGAGARWVVVAQAEGGTRYVMASRLRHSRVFVGSSVDALATQLESWLDERTGNH